MMVLALILSLCSIAESVLAPYPFTLLFIILTSIFRQRNIDILAFLAGIILDLLTLRPLGTDSIFFIILIYLGGRYRKKIYEGALIYRLLYLLIAYVIYNGIFYKSFNPFSFLATVFLSIILLIRFEKIFPGKNKSRLSV